MEFLSQYGLFLLKTATLVIAILIGVGGVIALLSRGKDKSDGTLSIEKLNDFFDDLRHTLQREVLEKKAFKKILKAEKKQLKKTHETIKPRIFVIDFNGDIRASAVEALRNEVSAILTMADPTQDEVVLRLESAGGFVHSYGLAASQLKRLRDKKIPLTAIIDKIAASGGYLMAAVADRILSAPFAILGSIGVVAQIPNFHRFLKSRNIDFDVVTAGEYKRTMTIFGENTQKDREKFQQEIDETHTLFKNFVKENRQQLDITQVGTGEHWYGQTALNYRLVDALMTSDDYLLSASKKAEIYKIRFTAKQSIIERLFQRAASVFSL